MNKFFIFFILILTICCEVKSLKKEQTNNRKLVNQNNQNPTELTETHHYMTHHYMNPYMNPYMMGNMSMMNPLMMNPMMGMMNPMMGMMNPMMMGMGMMNPMMMGMGMMNPFMMGGMTPYMSPSLYNQEVSHVMETQEDENRLKKI